MISYQVNITQTRHSGSRTPIRDYVVTVSRGASDNAPITSGGSWRPYHVKPTRELHTHHQLSRGASKIGGARMAALRRNGVVLGDANLIAAGNTPVRSHACSGIAGNYASPMKALVTRHVFIPASSAWNTPASRHSRRLPTT